MSFSDVTLTVDIRSLADNPFQHRIDYTQIDALAESIANQGVLQPPVVRLKPTLRKKLRKETSYQKKLETLVSEQKPNFELAFGHRRIRALLELAKQNPDYYFLTLTIRDLSNEEMQEIALTENIQRTDVHPYHLARSIAELMVANNGATEKVASKLGKTKRWVIEHIRFLELPELAIQLWLGNVLSLAHIKTLIKYPEDIVSLALEDLLSPEYTWDEESRENVIIGYHCRKTPKEFEAFFKEKVQIQLSQAKFDLKRKDWAANQGSCLTCPLNTCNQATLFPDLDSENGICTNPMCFESKSIQTCLEHVKDIRSQGHTVYLISGSWYARESLHQAYGAQSEKVLNRDDFSSELTGRGGQKLAPQAVGICADWLKPDKFLTQVPIVLKGEYKDAIDPTLETWLDGHKRKMHNRQLRRDNETHKESVRIDQEVAYELGKLKTDDVLSDTLTEMLFGIIFTWSSSEAITQFIRYVKEGWMAHNKISWEQIPDIDSLKYISSESWKKYLSSSQQRSAIRFLLLMNVATGYFKKDLYLHPEEAQYPGLREEITERMSQERKAKWARQDEKTSQELERYNKRMEEIEALAQDEDIWFSKFFLQENWEELRIYQKIDPKFVAKKARLLKIKLKSDASIDDVVAVFKQYRPIILEELQQWQESNQSE